MYTEKPGMKYTLNSLVEATMLEGLWNVNLDRLHKSFFLRQEICMVLGKVESLRKMKTRWGGTSSVASFQAHFLVPDEAD